MAEQTNLTRRTFAKALGAGAMMLPFAGALAGCQAKDKGAASSAAGTSSKGDAKSQVIVTMPASSEPSAGFNPLVSWGCGEHVHEPLIQSTLLTTTVDMGFKNDLATDYKCSEDGLVWTFVIRDDVKFTDGEALTAKDVAFTLNGILNSETSECDLSMVKEARATDDFTVEVELNKPFNAFLYTLAVIGIVPEHAYSDSYGEKPIGSGRYMLERWDKGQQVILAANLDYYGEAPKMQRVVVVFKDEDASLASAKASEADVAYTSATFAANQPKGYDLLNCASVDSRGIALPTVPANSPKTRSNGAEYETGNNVTSDIAVRRAINYAIDRQLMIDHVLSGYAEPAYNVCDGMPWASDAMHIQTDVDKAKSILDEAGWAVASDGVRVKDGVRASVELYYPASDTVRQAIANEFADQMKGIGLEVNLNGAGWDEIYQHGYNDLVTWGWGSNSPIEMYNLYYSKGTGNFASYKNETVDKHIDAALSYANVEDSYEEWKLAQWDGSEGVGPQGGATWVWFANVDHLYFTKQNLVIAEQKLHPHGHGWSLVNNVDQWEWA